MLQPERTIVCLVMNNRLQVISKYMRVELTIQLLDLSFEGRKIS